jgi:hypothetical protein
MCMFHIFKINTSALDNLQLKWLSGLVFNGTNPFSHHYLLHYARAPCQLHLIDNSFQKHSQSHLSNWTFHLCQSHWDHQGDSSVIWEGLAEFRLGDIRLTLSSIRLRTKEYSNWKGDDTRKKLKLTTRTKIYQYRLYVRAEASEEQYKRKVQQIHTTWVIRDTRVGCETSGGRACPKFVSWWVKDIGWCSDEWSRLIIKSSEVWEWLTTWGRGWIRVYVILQSRLQLRT